MARTRKQPVKRVRKTKEKKQEAVKSSGFISKLGSNIKKVLRPLAILKKPFQNKFFNKLGSILKKVLLISYVSSSWKEVRQVSWPGRKETTKLTFAVFIFAIAFGIFVAIIDFGLDKLFREVVL